MNSCIFCKIAAGEIPSATLYEDENFRVILDIAPAAKGHAILLPKKHAANLFEADEEMLAKALPVVKKVSAALCKTLNCDGINILQNNGEAAGQTVFHLHIHMIPRYKEDTVKIGWAQGSYSEGEAAKLAEEIRAQM